MSAKSHIIKTAPFTELTAVPVALVSNTAFDIVIEDKITLTNYCSALLNKLFEISQSQFRNFIDYHCGKVKEPGTWLNKLEKLVAINQEEFSSKKLLCRFAKLYSIIEMKRKEMETKTAKEVNPKIHQRFINANAEDRYFSFHETKSEVEKIQNHKKQIVYLTKEIFAYQNADLISKNNKLQDYDVQCRRKIEELKTIRNLEIEFEKETREKNSQVSEQNISNMVIRVDGPTNILTHAFKQFMFTLKPNGNPYMNYPIKTIAEFLCENFLDENGKPLAIETVKTYLQSTRTDKDPNTGSTVKF